MSYLVYCVSVWASTYPTNLNRIVILQKNVQLSNKQILFNTFDDSLPMQMPNSTQSKLGLLIVSIGFTTKEILVYLQEHCNET